MANPFEKVSVARSTGKYYHHPLPSYHLTTQDFFHIRPVYYKEMTPAESLRVRHSNFCRLMPLQRPFLGGCRIVNRAFFVPYRTIFPYFNDFITDTESIDATGTVKVSQMPWVYNSDLAAMFINYYANSTSNLAYDFSSGTTKYMFTDFGRRVYNILTSLGISVDFTKIDDNDKGIPIALQNVLAFMKVYADWYTPGQYDVDRQLVEQGIYDLRLGGQITDINKLRAMFNVLYNMSLYDSDYFTAAFDDPMTPNQGTITSVQIPEIKDYSKSVKQPSGAANNSSIAGDSRVFFDADDAQTPPPYIEGKFAYGSDNAQTDAQMQSRFRYRGVVTMLNQYMIDSLKALTDYIRRYQLVGARTLDRYTAMFGIELEASKLNRSIYLGKSESIVEVSDVMATANTDTDNDGSVANTPLGDYAGKGISYQKNGEYSYKSDEEGCFIILSTIIPKIGYVQGVNRYNLHIDRLDFYNGDFDNIGVQAIARAELFNDGKTLTEQTSRPQSSERTGVFGYTKRYAEYVTANNWLSGDFRLGSRNEELQRWHLFRIFRPSTSTAWALINHHSESFLHADQSQYDRIFNYDESDYDHFIVAHQFDVESYNHCSPLFDLYDFDEGKRMMMRLNGTNMN